MNGLRGSDKDGLDFPPPSPLPLSTYQQPLQARSAITAREATAAPVLPKRLGTQGTGSLLGGEGMLLPLSGGPSSPASGNNDQHGQQQRSSLGSTRTTRPPSISLGWELYWMFYFTTWKNHGIKHMVSVLKEFEIWHISDLTNTPTPITPEVPWDNLQRLKIVTYYNGQHTCTTPDLANLF